MSLTINEYNKIAEKIIVHYTRGMADKDIIRNDPEVIGEAIRQLHIADETYDPTKGMTLNSWRYTRVKYVIKTRYAQIKTQRTREVQLGGLTNGMLTTIDTISNEHNKVSINPLSELIRREEAEHVHFLLRNAALSENERKSVSMYYLDGMTMKTIADELKVSVQMIDQHIKNALYELRIASGVQ